MATTLTTSYQKIATINLTYGKIYTYAKYTSQNLSTRQTTYKIKSTYYASQYVSFSSATAKLDGTSKSYGYTTMSKGETTIQELTRTLSHNTDGSSTTKSISTVWDATFGGDGSSSASIVAPKMNIKATLKSAQDFNDEQDPTITYSNPAGNSVSSLQACISLTGSSADIAYRNIPKTGTSYTFPLTAAEKNVLINATTTSNSRTVKFYIKTVIGGTTYYADPITKTFSVVNANPTLTNEDCTFEELNTNVITYLGSSSASTVIQNMSKVRITATPTAKKSATITKVTIGNKNITESPYQADIDMVSNNISITATDSRKNVSSPAIEYTPTMIEYQPVKENSLIVNRVIPTGSDIRLQFESVYYQKTFGSTNNNPTIKYQIGSEIDEEHWITLTNGTDYTVDTVNNKITADITLTNALDYRNSAKLFIRVNDLLSSWDDSRNITKGIPVFEFGNDEVQVNGNLIIADTDRENPMNIFAILGLDTNTYDPTHTYAVGDLTIYSHAIWECNTANTTGTWDSSKWDLVPIIKQ